MTRGENNKGSNHIFDLGDIKFPCPWSLLTYI
jgi:hypothetical protein